MNLQNQDPKQNSPNENCAVFLVVLLGCTQLWTARKQIIHFIFYILLCALVHYRNSAKKRRKNPNRSIAKVWPHNQVVENGLGQFLL